MLCVNRNVPIVGAPTDGDASDKTLNFVYIADSAFVTKDNLEKANCGHSKF
jgi:hypothetical protein